MTDLHAALAARATARQRHQDATAAFARITDARSARQTKLAQLESAESEWVVRQARRVRRWAITGAKGEEPQLVTDAKVQQRLASARADAAAVELALREIQRAEGDARRELANAETAVRDIAVAIIAAEGEREAEAIIAAESELEERRTRLRGLRELVAPTILIMCAAPTVGDDVQVRGPDREKFERAVIAHSRLHTRRDQLDTSEVEPAAIAHWRARLDELLADGGVAPSSPYAQVA